MAVVIPFRHSSARRAPRADVIAFYEELLERAKRGDVQGAISVFSIAGAPDEISLCGEFIENLPYAEVAARVGFDALIGHAVCREVTQSPAERSGRKRG